MNFDSSTGYKVSLSKLFNQPVYFIEHGATITSKYYIVEPLIKYDIRQLFPDDMQ